jgi:transcriptional pleiotropic repressor
MAKDILTKIRELNAVLTKNATEFVPFDEICTRLYHTLETNVYVIDNRGKVLAAKFDEDEEKPLVKDEKIGTYVMPKTYNEMFLATVTTKANLTYDAIRAYYGDDYEMADKFHTIIPVSFGGKRVATFLFVRSSKAFSDEDIAVCEYGATVMGIEILQQMRKEEATDERERNAVLVAVKTLSYSEREAAVKVFEELDGDEGRLIASKIADKSGITRSVIVNALRKLESAGVIKTSSLGMKGTMIEITNKFLRDGLNGDLYL